MRAAVGITIMILASGMARGQSLEQLEKCDKEARKTFQVNSYKDRIEFWAIWNQNNLRQLSKFLQHKDKSVPDIAH